MIDRLEVGAAWISRGLALLATTALIVVAVLVCSEIVARWLLGFSLIGISDISSLVVAVAVVAAFPIVTMRRAHLVIELLRGQFGARARVMLAYAGGWVLAAALALFTWRLGMSAVQYGSRNAVTQVIELPMALIALANE